MSEPEAVREVYRKKGVRLNAEISPLLTKYFYAPTEGRTWKAFHMFDKAHTVMTTEEGIIPKAAGTAILKALRRMEAEGAEQVRESLGGHMHCGEAYAAMIAGPEMAGWIHVGRSSGDLQAVGARVATRELEVAFMKALIGLRRTLLDRAEDHIDTVMPGYTHLQHAEPITLAFYLLSFVHQFARDCERFQEAYARTNMSPAGCGILTTTDFPINRKRTQKLMGFDGALTNAKDAIWTVDYLAECLSCIQSTAGGLTRLADDLGIWHSSEFGMVEIPDEFCGTSSIMPQKKNPAGTETVRGLSADVSGCMTAFWAQTSHQSDSCEMLMMAPLTLFRAAERCLAALQVMDGVVRGLKIHQDVMAQRVGGYWSQATSLANTLVREKRLPFRSAHQIVGVLVRMAYEQGRTPAAVSVEMLDEAARQVMGRPVQLDEHRLREALDPSAIVRSKKTVGGTAPERVREDLRDCRLRLQYDERVVDQIESTLARSERELEAAVDALLS
jgi:argininosuccinate lyase